jgi:hypothetical protein
MFESKRYYRGWITIWCLLLAEWIYIFADSWIKRDWSDVAAAAFFLAFCWSNLWRDFDESKDE